MKFYSHTGKAQYQIDEAAFVSPVRVLSPLQRQYLLWRFFHEPKYHPNKMRCNNLIHGMSIPRG